MKAYKPDFTFSTKARYIFTCQRHRGLLPSLVNHINVDFHRSVALEFETSTSNLALDTWLAYRQLGKEVEDLVKFFEEQGVKVIPYLKDPYRNPAEMIADIDNNSEIRAYASELKHSSLTDEQNFYLRVVHDLIGHAAFGNGFGNNPIGEENAYRIHCGHFSELAQLAMATEFRGQTSWYHYGPYENKTKQFAEQKSFILSKASREIY